MAIIASRILSVIKLLLGIAVLVLTIVSLAYLVKVKNHAHNEPTNRGYYIDDDPLNYYSEGDFCYDKYRNYESQGAFKIFDIKMKKIRQYSKALLATYIVGLVLSVLSILFNVIQQLCMPNINCIGCFLLLVNLLNIINSILTIIFFIILSVNYYKGEFGDFEDFSKCSYFNDSFRKDYHFVSVVKDNFKKFFILYLISIILNIISLIVEGIGKRMDRPR